MGYNNKQVNFDLDVANVLQDFDKESESEGFLYIRTDADVENLRSDTMVMMSGRLEVLSMALLGAAEEQNILKGVILTAAVNILAAKEEDKEIFLKALNETAR